MNNVQIIGRLTKDCETRFTQGGAIVGYFTIAVDRWGKEKDKADFFQCVCFSRTAEWAEKFLKKGTKVAISGRLQNDTYEKNGVKTTVTKIIVAEVEFAESKPKNADVTLPNPALDKPKEEKKDAEFLAFPEDEELPFQF